jgi:hypothetical protein
MRCRDHPPAPPNLTSRSDELLSADKENAPDPSQPIPNPKKRTKTAAGMARQAPNPSTVLSPKSSNSCTLSQSPVRPPLGSPRKQHVSRPASPLKPASPARIAVAAATNTLASLVGDRIKGTKPAAGTVRKASKQATEAKAGATRAKRGGVGAVPSEAESRTVSSSSSNASGMTSLSTGTTVVKKIGKALNASSKTLSRKAVGTGVVKKVVEAKAEAPATGKRVLRKRA